MSEPKREGLGRMASHAMIKSRSVCVPMRWTWKTAGKTQSILGGGGGTMRDLTLHVTRVSVVSVFYYKCMCYLKTRYPFLFEKHLLGCAGFSLQHTRPSLRRAGPSVPACTLLVDACGTSALTRGLT